MRDIDTDALEAVARSLGVGAPATATRQVVFDDDHLQQALDVGPLVRYRAGRSQGPNAQGWFNFALEVTLVGAGDGSGSASIHDQLADILQPTDVVWLYNVAFFGTSNITISNFIRGFATVTFPPIMDAGLGTTQPFVVATFNDTEVLTSGLLGPLNPDFHARMPIALPPGSSVAAGNITSGGNTTMEVMFLCRILPAGVPPIP